MSRALFTISPHTSALSLSIMVSDTNSVEITIEEFQDIIDALTDARELVEDIDSLNFLM